MVDFRVIAANPDGADLDGLKALSTWLNRAPGNDDFLALRMIWPTVSVTVENINGVDDFNSYLLYTICAQSERLKGNIRSARQWEDIADKYYGLLPGALRW